MICNSCVYSRCRLFLAQAGGIRNGYFRALALARGPVPGQGAFMIILAFGANLPGPDETSPQETCRRAIAAIAAIPGITVEQVSPFYVTAPVPVSDQPPYVNGVLRASGQVDPAALLGALLEIESRFGRRRAGANAARSLDLDIIAMGDLIRAAPDPVLPHPRAHERAFVLRPLADIAPGWRHPRLGRTAAELLAALPPQAIEPMNTGSAERHVGWPPS
jgi:2-amino-4-hydroxy-6-hydroxymethyldihydropteridine diphosphokinase